MEGEEETQDKKIRVNNLTEATARVRAILNPMRLERAKSIHCDELGNVFENCTDERIEEHEKDNHTIYKVK